MTELEELKVKPLIESGMIKFYCRYVDDTLLLVKPENIDTIHKIFNTFDKNIQFTVDKFANDVPHFLDIEISPDGLCIFRKDTNTGLYTNFNSYSPWSYRKAWISSLVNQAKKLCSNNNLSKELVTIRKFASWNNFPKYVTNKLIKYAVNKTPCINDQDLTNNDDNNDNKVTLWLRIPYAGQAGEKLVNSFKQRIKFCLKI